METAQMQQQSEVYIKRWEPQEDFRDIPDHVIDALCEAFESEEERKAARWFDGTPVFPQERENTVPAGRAAADRGMCPQQNEVQQ